MSSNENNSTECGPGNTTPAQEETTKLTTDAPEGKCEETSSEEINDTPVDDGEDINAEDTTAAEDPPEEQPVDECKDEEPAEETEKSTTVDECQDEVPAEEVTKPATDEECEDEVPAEEVTKPATEEECEEEVTKPATEEECEEEVTKPATDEVPAEEVTKATTDEECEEDGTDKSSSTSEDEKSAETVVDGEGTQSSEEKDDATMKRENKGLNTYCEKFYKDDDRPHTYCDEYIGNIDEAPPEDDDPILDEKPDFFTFGDEMEAEDASGVQTFCDRLIAEEGIDLEEYERRRNQVEKKEFVFTPKHRKLLYELWAGLEPDKRTVTLIRDKSPKIKVKPNIVSELRKSVGYRKCGLKDFWGEYVDDRLYYEAASKAVAENKLSRAVEELESSKKCTKKVKQ